MFTFILRRSSSIHKRNKLRFEGVANADGNVRTITNFTFVAPPGSGKGTYGAMLARKLGTNFLSVGDLLRAEGKKGGALGDAVCEFQARGELVPDHMVEEVVLRAIKQRSSDKDKEGVGYILDGFPRTSNQAFTSFYSWPEHLKTHYAIKIEVPDVICRGKILGRRWCIECEKTFNICNVENGSIEILNEIEEGKNEKLDFPGSKAGTCTWNMVPMLPDPKCPCNKSKNWERRIDDTPSIISKRIQDYHSVTKPVLDFFHDRKKLVKFTPYKGVDDLPALLNLVSSRIYNVNDKCSDR